MTTATVATPLKPVPPPLTDHPLVASCDVKKLTEALAFVGAGLPSRPPMAVLLGIRISADADGVSLSAFDYELSCTETIEGLGTGKALVPGLLLKDIVKALDPGPVQLRVNEGVTHLDVIQGDLELSLPLLPLANYPALPTAKTSKAKTVATVTGSDLTELNRVTVAAGRDATLPVLTGVLLENEAGFLRSAATDRYRLAVTTTTVKTKLEEKGGMLVPARTLAFAVKHLGKADSITLQHSEQSDGILFFDGGNRQITIRLLCGEFPRYRSLIPTDLPVTIDVDSQALTKATKQVALVARRNAPVRVKVTAALGLVLGAGDAHDGSASKKVAAAVTGVRELETIETAYNPAYLLDGLAAITAKGQVNIAFNTPTRPAIFTSPGDDTFLYLLMPVRLSSS